MPDPETPDPAADPLPAAVAEYADSLAAIEAANVRHYAARAALLELLRAGKHDRAHARTVDGRAWFHQGGEPQHVQLSN